MAGKVKKNTVDGHMQKKVISEPVWISDAFEFRELEFYKLVITVTSDDNSQKCILYPLENAIDEHQLKSQNVRINLRVY